MYRIGALCEAAGEPPKRYDPEFFDALAAYTWPGNVRELFGVVEAAYHAAGSSQVLFSRHLPQEVRIAVARANLAAKSRPAPAVEPGLAAEPAEAPRPAPGGLPNPGTVITSYSIHYTKLYE